MATITLYAFAYKMRSLPEVGVNALPHNNNRWVFNSFTIPILPMGSSISKPKKKFNRTWEMRQKASMYDVNTIEKHLLLLGATRLHNTPLHDHRFGPFNENVLDVRISFSCTVFNWVFLHLYRCQIIYFHSVYLLLFLMGNSSWKLNPIWMEETMISLCLSLSLARTIYSWQNHRKKTDANVNKTHETICSMPALAVDSHAIDAHSFCIEFSHPFVKHTLQLYAI